MTEHTASKSEPKQPPRPDRSDHLSERDRAIRVEARDAWAASDERSRVKKFGIWLAATFALAPIAVGLVTYLVMRILDSTPGGDQSSRVTALAGAGIAAFVVAYFGLASLWLTYRSARRSLLDRLTLREARAEVQKAEEALGPNGPESNLDLVSLWSLTHKRLDYYHELATKQADASFRHAQVAMTTGFALILATVIISLFPATVAGRVVVGALGTVAALLGGYVGKTFLRSQETAASHLRAYFLQPLEFSRYLIAERLVSTLSPERRDDGLMFIIQGIANPQGSSEAPISIPDGKGDANGA